MKKIFDSAYGKDSIALILAILFSADTLKWEVMPFYFIIFGPLLAFIPRITTIYFTHKRKEDAENAQIAVMFVLYFALGIGFVSLPNSGEVFMRILISAAFYYIALRIIIILETERRETNAFSPTGQGIIAFAIFAFFVIEAFNTKPFIQQWWQYILWAFFSIVFLSKSIIKARKKKESLQENP